MEELNALKNEVRELLVERIGVLSDSDQINLKRRAQQIGLDNRQFGLLLQEIHSSINWNALRDERQGKDRVVRPINIFGEEVRSLEKLGEVLLENRVKALRYLEDNIFLKENVTYLSHQNVDLAMEIIDLYLGEKNAERRFLKICYQLDPELPFMAGGESFSTVEELLDRGWMNHEFFMGIYNKFATGHLQIWISRRFQDRIAVLPIGNSFSDFLYFLYSLNPNYPFYIGNELFLQPEDLVSRARRDLAFWPLLLASFDDNLLTIWFERRGTDQMIFAFKTVASQLRAVEKNSESLSRSLVQKLLEALAPDIEVPDLSASIEKISFLDVQSKPLVLPIIIRLNNQGFVRGKVALDKNIPGIEISKEWFSLSDLDGNSSVIINLKVDPAKLTKDTLHTLSLKIQTDYQSISIPVALKTIFPMRAFMLCLLRYGFFGAVFMGFIRLLISAANSHTGWLLPDLAWKNISAQVPLNHFAYIAIFILAILVPLLGWPKIKKIEQI